MHENELNFIGWLQYLNIFVNEKIADDVLQLMAGVAGGGAALNIALSSDYVFERQWDQLRYQFSLSSPKASFDQVHSSTIHSESNREEQGNDNQHSTLGCVSIGCPNIKNETMKLFWSLLHIIIY